MTAAVDREVLREWRDRHSDVRPDREGNTCVRLVWAGDEFGLCGRPSQWIVRRRPMCEAHTVERIRTWLGEVSE
jgi:hypothetical protein